MQPCMQANLLPHMFDGEGGDPRENQLEHEYHALAPKLQEVRAWAAGASLMHEARSGCHASRDRDGVHLCSVVGRF